MCETPDCQSKTYARGLCSRHYKQLLRHGRVQPDTGPRPCAADPCNRQAVTRGWCHGHYLRWSRTGDVQADRPLVRRERGVCEVADCGRRAVSHRLCEAHRQRSRSTGNVAAGVPLRSVLGTGFVTQGYRTVPVPVVDRWLVGGASSAAEHRLVLARALGRCLTSDESVHHRNGDRGDNNLDNLELWSRYQPAGQRISDKLRWARQILDRYDTPADLEVGVAADTALPGYVE